MRFVITRACYSLRWHKNNLWLRTGSSNPTGSAIRRFRCHCLAAIAFSNEVPYFSTSAIFTSTVGG